MTAAQAMVALTAILLLLAPVAHGHGFMFEPQARNYIHDSEGCPHCLSAGGPYEVSQQSTLVWPQGVHGQCGDPLSSLKHEAGGPFGPVGPVATYNAGQVISISLLVTANHGGRHAFRLCGRSDNLDEGCFAANVLQRADGTGPYTWVPLDGGPATPSSGYSPQATLLGQSGEVYTTEYKLPDGVTCASCTLQWYWTTSNSCDLPDSPFGSTGNVMCNTLGPYPEEFWNCADIAIGGATPDNSGTDDATTTYSAVNGAVLADIDNIGSVQASAAGFKAAGFGSADSQEASPTNSPSPSRKALPGKWNAP